jgi:hypothetical protein
MAAVKIGSMEKQWRRILVARTIFVAGDWIIVDTIANAARPNVEQRTPRSQPATVRPWSVAR